MNQTNNKTGRRIRIGITYIADIDCFSFQTCRAKLSVKYPSLVCYLPAPTHDASINWNSTGKVGRIGRHRAETHRHFNIRFFGPMPPDASDFPGGIPAIDGGRHRNNPGGGGPPAVIWQGAGRLLSLVLPGIGGQRPACRAPSVFQGSSRLFQCLTHPHQTGLFKQLFYLWRQAPAPRANLTITLMARLGWKLGPTGTRPGKRARDKHSANTSWPDVAPGTPPTIRAPTDLLAAGPPPAKPRLGLRAHLQ